MQMEIDLSVGFLTIGPAPFNSDSHRLSFSSVVKFIWNILSTKSRVQLSVHDLKFLRSSKTQVIPGSCELTTNLVNVVEERYWIYDILWPGNVCN
jgi:hypothetical protein